MVIHKSRFKNQKLHSKLTYLKTSKNLQGKSSRQCLVLKGFFLLNQFNLCYFSFTLTGHLQSSLKQVIQFSELSIFFGQKC